MERNHSLIVLGLGFSLALLCLVVAWPRVSRADPGTLYVSATDPTCGGNAPCYSNVQDAIDAAPPLLTILVATGTYTDPATGIRGYVVAITKTLTLRGGYDASFAEPPDPLANPTTLNAQHLGRVISVTGDISPTIEGFVITGGDATGLGGASSGQDGGGGIFCYLAHPIVCRNVVSNNVASKGDGAAGGGIYLRLCHGAVVAANTIISNTASTGGTGLGGGLHLTHCRATVISENTIISNTASSEGTGYGGGILSFFSDVTFGGNSIVDNVGSSNGYGQGGGIWVQSGVVSVRGNTVRGNVAATPNRGYGGGLLVISGDGLTLDSNLFLDNEAQADAGMSIKHGSVFTMTNNLVAQNDAAYQGDGVSVDGSETKPTIGTLLHNTIADNVGGSGQGLYVGDCVTLTLTNNIIAGHTVGITNTNPASSTVSADHTLFYDNATDYGSGVASTNEVRGDPRFVNPSALDYHIRRDSAAIDAGIDAAVATDIDGDRRPSGLGFEIGADEIEWAIYLPLELRNH